MDLRGLTPFSHSLMPTLITGTFTECLSVRGTVLEPAETEMNENLRLWLHGKLDFQVLQVLCSFKQMFLLVSPGCGR